jgi:hypothetical protein
MFLTTSNVMAAAGYLHVLVKVDARTSIALLLGQEHGRTIPLSDGRDVASFAPERAKAA